MSDRREQMIEEAYSAYWAALDEQGVERAPKAAMGAAVDAILALPDPERVQPIELAEGWSNAVPYWKERAEKAEAERDRLEAIAEEARRIARISWEQENALDRLRWILSEEASR